MLQHKHIQRIFFRSAILFIALMQITFAPVARLSLSRTYAQEANETSPPATTSEEQGTPATTGPTSPTGADANEYVFNPETGLYESERYTWDPVTKQTKPKYEPTYSYNPCTGRWDTTEWYYDAAAGKYVANSPTAGNVCPGTAPTTTSPSTSSATAPATTSAAQLSGGPDDNSTVNSTNTNSGTFDLYFNANISHNMYLDSASGNVLLSGNTTAGNGVSGSSDSMANIINMLQSSWNPNGGNINMFNVDIEGDVIGDFYIDPTQMFGDVDSVNTATNNELDVNVETDATMQNDITVDATSGDVEALSNTKVGNLSSGTANAVANVVNMINSIIASGDSFIGTINIHGNYEGDILLPEESIQALLASNDIPKTTINTSQLANNETVVDISNDQSVTNNVTANANSGDVSVSGNTNAGSATSGDSNTNITVLNLTGQQVVGSNALLVFVNVLGEWVGMLVNAPAGSTAAAFGSGDTSVNTTANNSADINIENDFEIENNINLNAQSGDVKAEHNTKVGDATSGDATASANITNMTNSGFSLSKWFGLLFINVFGSWRGSFGINTAMGNATVPPASPANSHEEVISTPAQVFRFAPSSAPVALGAEEDTDATQAISEALEANQSKSTILGSSTDNNGSSGPTSLQAAFNWSSIVPVALLAITAIGATEAVAFLGNRRKASTF